MKSGIYRILNLANGKSYVGQTVDVEDRLYKHLTLLRVGTHCNRHLQSAFGKYGESSFEFRILECVDESMLDEREQSWIAYYKSDDNRFGYNSDGGGKGNRIVSAECRAKIAASLTGKKASEETRRKMSESRKRNPARLSPEDYARGVATRRARGGYVVSEETKRKMREGWERKRLGKTDDASGPLQAKMKTDQPADLCVMKVPFCRPIDHLLPCPPWRVRVTRKSTPPTKEHREIEAKRHFSTERGRKISDAKRGWNPSPETRRRMSDGQQARYNNLRANGERLQSPEQRVNLSLGAKEYWANYRLNKNNSNEKQEPERNGACNGIQN